MKHNELQIVTLKNRDLDILDHLFQIMCYSHWVNNLYVHKTKDYDTTQVKRKCGRPPKQKTGLDNTQKPAATTCTV